MANKEFQVRHGLVVNNTVLVANTITNNVGIGTSTPAYTLDVRGSINASSILINGSLVSDAGPGANAYSVTVGASSNAWSNSIVLAANNYSGQMANSSNGRANTVGLSSNNFSGLMANSSNGYAVTVGASSNAYANLIGTSANNNSGLMANSANSRANTVGLSSNNFSGVMANSSNGYAITVGASSNAWSNSIVLAANNYAGQMANSANARANTVGSSANAYAVTVGTGANAYAATVGTGANSYATTVGTSANAYAATVGTGANSYATAVGTSANSFAGLMANSANNWANTKLSTSGGTVTGNVSITGWGNTEYLLANSYFDITPQSTAPYKEGRLYYSTEEKTWVGYGDYTDFEQTLGEREWVRCRNSTANTINRGKAVYVTGVHIPGHPYHGHHPTIELADASDINKKDVIGITGHDIPAGQHGYVVVRGYIEGLNTSSLASATRVHLGFNGDIVNDAPEYPNWPMDVGICLTSNTTNGTLYVTLTDHSMERLRVQSSARVGGDLFIEGDLTVLGSQSVVSTNSLQVGTQYIYMGYGDSVSNAAVTFTGSGLNDLQFKGHYESAGNTSFYVIISNTSPDLFSWGYDSSYTTFVQSNVTIQYQTTQPLSNGISVYFNANTGHTIGDKWNVTVFSVSADFGLVGNHIDGPNGYTHAGIFRDATDGTFKMFNSYDPEPNGNIDIANTSFNLANLQINKVTATQVFEGATRLGDVATTASNALIVGAAAFDKANTGSGSASITLITDTVNATRYLVFASNTSGNLVTANVRTSLTFNPSSNNLSVGNTVFATHFDNTSDKNLKENIESIIDGSIILDLNPVSFNWKATGEKSYGLIAQEVEPVIPEIVHTNDDGMKTIEYIQLISLLISVVQEQQQQIDDINRRLNNMPSNP